MRHMSGLDVATACRSIFKRPRFNGGYGPICNPSSSESSLYLMWPRRSSSLPPCARLHGRAPAIRGDRDPVPSYRQIKRDMGGFVGHQAQAEAA